MPGTTLIYFSYARRDRDLVLSTINFTVICFRTRCKEP